MNLDEFDKLSVAERIQLVQDLWDRIAERPEEIPISDELKEELDRSLAEHRANPQAAVDWDTLKKRLLKNRR